MEKISFFVVLLLAVNCSATLNQYVFEFGQNSGMILSNYEGTIPLLHSITNVDVTVPPGATVTYVRVTVNALSPPKVDYYGDRSRVTIVYDWTQISYSIYSIVVKGKSTFGEVLTYVYTGIVPAYESLYNLRVKPRLSNVGSDRPLTYLRVLYSNPMSKVNVSYNPNSSTIEFYIKYPFMAFPFGVDGYS